MSKTNPRTRLSARMAAVQALFQAEQAGENPETVIGQFERHRLGGEDWEAGEAPDAHAGLFAAVVRGAARGAERIDVAIAAHLPATWPMGRLDPVLRALLRAGCAELLNPDGPPVSVVINEYIDVAHRFFSGEEPKLANAVLDAAARDLRPGKAG